jgi:hypothetical protein
MKPATSRCYSPTPIDRGRQANHPAHRLKGRTPRRPCDPGKRAARVAPTRRPASLERSPPPRDRPWFSGTLPHGRRGSEPRLARRWSAWHASRGRRPRSPLGGARTTKASPRRGPPPRAELERGRSLRRGLASSPTERTRPERGCGAPSPHPLSRCPRPVRETEAVAVRWCHRRLIARSRSSGSAASGWRRR